MAKQYKHRHTETYKDVRIDVKADTLSELMDKVAAKKQQIDRQILSPDTKLRLFAEKYLKIYKEPTVGAGWYKELKQIAENKIVPGIGDRPIGKIKPMEIQQFLNTLTGFSNSYIKKVYDLTCQIFRYAYKNGMTTIDLTLNLERPSGIEAAKGRSITDYEREVLLRVLNGHRGNLYCKIMLYCGLRPSEISALVWKDIDFKNGVIDINKDRKKNGTVGKPKSKDSIRKVPIPDHFIGEMQQYKREPFELVCPQQNGSPHTESSRKTMWKNIKRLMNIEMGAQVKRNQLIPPLPLAEDFKMYNLRHTYCTDLEKMGVPINIARQLMGHSTIELTSKIYTHASVESLNIARNLINGYGNQCGNNGVNH